MTHQHNAVLARLVNGTGMGQTDGLTDRQCVTCKRPAIVAGLV